MDQNAESPLAACAAADRLPSDGDERRPGSNFQARRLAQMAALKAAFWHFFQGELRPEAAKDLLRLAGDSAEAVYEAMEKGAAKKPDAPLGYVKAILRREAAERPATPAPQATADEADIRRPYTPADRARARVLAARLARQGYDTEGVE